MAQVSNYNCTWWSAYKQPPKSSTSTTHVSQIFTSSSFNSLILAPLPVSFTSMASACSKTTSLPPKRGQIKAQIFRIFVNTVVFVALRIVEAVRSIINSQVEVKVEEKLCLFNATATMMKLCCFQIQNQVFVNMYLNTLFCSEMLYYCQFITEKTNYIL